MQPIKFTVVIPNHNYGKWIGGAIDSVVNDTSYLYKRIVVVDDGSTDDSWEIICNKLNIQKRESCKMHDGYVSGIKATAYRFDQAGGPSRARNIAIKHTMDYTDVFGFLDADDEYKQGKIGLSIKKFMEDPIHLGAVYTDYDTIDEAGITRREYKEPFNRERLARECIVHSACLVKKEALERCGTYDEEMRTCEDYDLWMRISEAYCLVHIPESLMLVRVGSHNSTATVKPEIWQKNWQRVMDKAQARSKNG